VRRRFLKRLEQGVERVRRQHVHLVDEVHLVAAAGGRVLHVVEQLASVVHLGARGGIDLDQIDEPPLVDLAAGGTLAARRRAESGFAVQALSEDAGDGGFADTPCPREQKGVVHPIGGQGVGERLQHVLLACELLEALRTPLAGQCGVTHPIPRLPMRATPTREAARTSWTPAPDRTGTVAPFRAWRD